MISLQNFLYPTEENKLSAKEFHKMVKEASIPEVTDFLCECDKMGSNLIHQSPQDKVLIMEIIKIREVAEKIGRVKMVNHLRSLQTGGKN